MGGLVLGGSTPKGDRDVEADNRARQKVLSGEGRGATALKWMASTTESERKDRMHISGTGKNFQNKRSRKRGSA